MDIISFGTAGKAANSEKQTRNVLGQGVEGTFPHVKGRIDEMDRALARINEKANRLIINDAVNIMKANAKLNVLMKTARYKHTNMIFEDFLDATGIDPVLSSGYEINLTTGLVKASAAAPYTIITTQELADVAPEKVILIVQEGAKPTGVIPVMTADSSNGMVASASNIYSAGYEAYKAFTGIGNSLYWMANVGTNLWLKIDLGKKVSITGYALQAKFEVAALPAQAPKHFRLEGSNDNATWTPLDERTNEIGWTAWEVREYTCTPAAYRYYRLFIVTNNGGGVTSLQDFQLLGSADETATVVNGSYFISRDDGVTWNEMIPGTLYEFTSESPLGNKIRLKAEMPADVSLLNYGLTWS
jgi:uncharacterized protein YaiE (UPF0345 family)